MIRQAEHADIETILDMGERFFQASGYSDMCSFNRDDTKITLELLIDSGSLLTDGKHGMIGFLVFPMYMDRSCIVAQELFWWVDKDKRNTRLGLELLKAAEKRAAEMGASNMIMLCLEKCGGDGVGEMYQRLGYNKRETNYMRAL